MKKNIVIKECRTSGYFERFVVLNGNPLEVKKLQRGKWRLDWAISGIDETFKIDRWSAPVLEGGGPLIPYCNEGYGEKFGACRCPLWEYCQLPQKVM